MKAWRVVRHGAPSEALSLEDIERPTVGPREVLVETRASVCNYNEVDACRGRYLTVNPPLPYTLGMEVLGTVVEAGPSAEHWLGRRVVGTARGAFGAHAEFVACGVDMVFDASANRSDTEAAACFFPFHLAWLGLHERGRLAAGETVLIHAAAGGVGSAAVQLAKAAGATVIATAGSDAKLDLVRGLGADVAVNYRTEDFVAAVNDATDGRGVDLVFDGVGGAVTQASLRALGRNGRLMIVGFASGIEAEEEASITGRQFAFGQFDVGGVLLAYAEEPLPARAFGVNLTPRAVGEEVHRHIQALLDDGAIRPVIGETVAHRDLPAALDRMEARDTVGRSVVGW